MPDYQKSKIYCIRSPNTDMVYIGSTVLKLCERMRDHRKRYKYWKDGKKHYSYSIKILEFGNAYIELIEDYPCDNVEQQRAREGFYIRKNIKDGFCCGQYVAGRSGKQYREDNKKKMKIQQKQYYEDNKEKIKIQHKQYYEDNKEILCMKAKQYQQDNKEKIKIQYKQYYEDNKEKIKIRKKQYQQDNKEKIKLRKNKKYDCECGDKYTYSHKQRHFRSKKHKEFESQNETQKH